MFTGFISIIIAILVYSVQFPEGPLRYPWYISLGMFASYCFFYALLCFRSFKKQVDLLGPSPSTDVWQRGMFQQRLNRHTFLALAFYALLLFSLQFKTILAGVPSETLRSLLGIFPFFLFLTILWFAAWPLHRRIFSSSPGRASYVFSQLRFNIPVIVPWLFATLCLDLASLLPHGIQENLLTHEWTQLILCALFFLGMGIFLPLLIQAIWGCKPVKDPAIRDLLADLCKATGVRVRRAILWPSMEAQVITAGVMGLVSRFRYVLLTPSIIKILSREELQSVLAHELGHAKRRHLHFYLLFFMGYAILSFLYPDVFFWFLYLSGVLTSFPDFFINGNRQIMAMIFFIPMILLLFIYFRYLYGFFSRNFERQADLFSLGIMGNAGPLVSALEKVALVNGIDRAKPNWHHFGIGERVRFLRTCERHKEVIAAHHKKIFFLKSSYVLGLLLLTGFFIFSQQNSPEKSVKLRLVEASLLKMEQARGDNPELHLLLANIRMGEKDLRGAMNSYRRVLELDPRNITALNNLAWLQVTGKDGSLRDPEEGLKLATRAVSIERKSYILDTLAEAWFVNGKTGKAIQAEEEAMTLQTGDKNYYRTQLKKFRRSLRQE